jgi:hypothetical protein
MRVRLIRVGQVALPLVAVLLSSCGGKSSSKPVHPVSGKVLVEGRPARHALVVLHPLGGSEDQEARPRGQVGADGTFTLSTYGRDDGAPAGEYAVTVEWWLSGATARTREGDGPPPANRLPGRYANPSTSGLRVRIGEGANELQPIQLRRR